MPIALSAAAMIPAAGEIGAAFGPAGLAIAAVTIVGYIAYEAGFFDWLGDVLEDGWNWLKNGFGKVVQKAKSVVQEDIISGILDGIDWICKAAGIKGKGKTNILEFRLPAWNKVKLDMQHIISGHTPGGGRGDKNKDKWAAGMTAAQITKAIQEAYQNAKKMGPIQYSWQDGVEHARQFFEGMWNNVRVEFYFDFTINQIDSAWPKY